MSEKKDLTRAEEVRERREKEKVQRTKRAAKEVTRPVPPTTTRTRGRVIAPKRRTSRNTRRRFQVALPIPGDEIRTLSIPRLSFGMRSVSFVILALLAVGLYLAYNLPYFRVTQAQITGNQMLSSQEVNVVMGVANQPIFTLKPADLETR